MSGELLDRDGAELLKMAAVAANDSTTLAEAAVRCLDAVCSTTGWDVGQLWLPSHAGEWRPSGISFCGVPNARYEKFFEASKRFSFRPGKGLPGVVAASGHPRWVTDVRNDPNFTRVDAAIDAGFTSCFAFPILMGHEVAAVVEFFTAQPTNPNESLLDVMAQVGRILGRVAERERSAEAVKESEERLRLVVDTANDAFVALDESGRVTEWNAQAELTFGWERHEILGEPLADIVVPPAFRDAHRAGIAHFLETGEAPVFGQRIELAALHRAGYEFPIELTVWPVRNRSGQYEFNAFVHDISERKEAEDRVAQSMRELEEFASTASHDLKSPLAIIIGYSELLDRQYSDRLDSLGVQMITSVRTAAVKMRQLIDDLLAFARAGGDPASHGPVDLNAAAAEAIDALSAEITAADARVDVADLPTVTGELGHLAQLFQNLIGNAVKYSAPHSRPEVAVAAQRDEPGWWRITVTDNGPGIPPDDRDRIFSMFERAAPSDVAGTGIGLAICQRIVDRQGGAIGIEEAPNGGSRFWFTLPAANGDGAVGLG